MAVIAEVALRVTVLDQNGIMVNRELPAVRFSPATGLPKEEVVSLTGSAFTALSPPASSKAVLIMPGTATSLTLKGVAGDSSSITLTPASNPIGADLFLTLGASPVVGISNGNSSAQNVTLLWL